MAKIREILAAAAGAVWTALSLGGCTAGAESLNHETGVIFEVTETGVYLAPEGTEGVSGATLIGFNGKQWLDEDGNTVLPADLEPGQVVEYSCTSVLETWPSTLSGCEQVTVTGKTEDVSELIVQWNAAQVDLSAGTDSYGMPVLQLLQESGGIASCTNPLRGSSSWSRDGSSVMQDSDHPLRWEDAHLVSVSLSAGKTLALSFSGTTGNPDSVTVLRWDASDRGSKSIPDGEAVELSDGYTFTAQSDSVYQVTARWEGEDTGGVLTWGFQTVD